MFSFFFLMCVVHFEIDLFYINLYFKFNLYMYAPNEFYVLLSIFVTNLFACNKI